MSSHSTLTISSNRIHGSASGSVCSGYFNETLGPNAEVYVDVETWNSDGFTLYLRVTNPNSGTLNYYIMNIGGASPVVGFYKMVSGSENQVGSDTSVSVATGNKIGFSVEDSGSNVVLKAWKDTGGGWSQIATATDSSSPLTGSGYAGVDTWQNNVYIDNFYAGTIISVPNAPTFNTATAGNAQVALAWTAPGSGPTPTGYKVKYGTSAGSYGTTVDVGNVTSYTVTSLTNGTTYYFVIVAYNGGGDSSNSTEKNATPSVGAPSAPTLNTVSHGNGQVTLGWGSVAGATGYRVKRGTSTGSYGTTTDVGNVTSYTPTGLTNATTYYFVVEAYNGSGTSAVSNERLGLPASSTGNFIRQSSSNGRYMEMYNGSSYVPVVLNGQHTWYEIQDSNRFSWGNPFDYSGYLDDLDTYGHTFIRLWAWEGGKEDDGSNSHYVTPTIWQRTGPGNVSGDGLPKYDLSKLNQAYFDRLRQRAIQAQSKGLAMSVMLCQGWNVGVQQQPGGWSNHPFNSSNNINGVNGDTGGNGDGREMHASSGTVLTYLQTYFEKVVDTLHDLDNVMWEIVNEAWDDSSVKTWVTDQADYIANYENTTYGKKHTVFATALFAGTNTWLTGSNSNIQAISPQGYYTTEFKEGQFPAATGGKVFLLDVDHIYGVSNPAETNPNAREVWQAFLRGYNYLMMDGVDDTYSANSVATGVRYALGDTVSYAGRMNLAVVTPDATAYMLSGGGKYLRLGNGAFSFAPANGTYTVEWWAISTRTVHTASNVTVSGSTTFTPPVSGDVVLFLQPVGGGSAPGAPTLTSASPANSSVMLAWSSVAGATGYKVKYGTTSGSYTTTVDVGNVTSYTVTSLTNGTTYYFVVSAYNASGDGSNSSQISATPTSGAVPSAPTLASLTPSSTQIVAAWGSVAGATGYKVRIGTSSGSYGAATVVGNVTSHTFTGLTNGTAYYVIVIATNANGDSGNSNELSGTPSATSRIQTKYNDMAVGDVVFLEKMFTFEALSVQQHAAPDAGKVYKSVTVNGQAGYEFEVSRNLDGSGKNDWLAGDSYVNTGSPGSGFIDQYSYTSVLARPLEYIAIDGALVDSFSVDLTLLSGSGGIAAFGVSNAKFDALHITIKQPAIYTTATIVYEYWNGSAWTTLLATVSEKDATNATVTPDWKTAGFLSAIWTPPADWAQTTIATKSAYWIRVRVSAATGWTQSPKHGGGKWITRGKRQYGPSIAFWRRMSSTWNDLREGGALGNLEGFYDYGVPTMGAAFGDPTAVWLGMDATNGIRMMNAGVTKGQIKPDGTWKFYGDANNYVEWNGTQVNVKGAINITGGSGYANLTDKPTSLAGINATEGSKLSGIAAGATVGATWGTNLSGIPSTLATPSGSGLYLSASAMGFYNGSAWRTYMNNSGQFFFYGASGARLQWDGSVLAGYDSSSNQQWATDATSGEIVAGSGRTIIGYAGIRMKAGGNFGIPERPLDTGSAATWIRGSGATIGSIYSTTSSTLGVGLVYEAFGESGTKGGGASHRFRTTTSGGASTDVVIESGALQANFISSLGSIVASGQISADGGISTCYNMTGQAVVSATSYGAFLVPAERDVTIKQWTMNTYVGTTNNGSNYWQFDLKRLSDSALIDSWNTSSWSAGTWGRSARALSSAITASSHLGVYVDIIKVGSPGSVQCVSMLYMQ